MAIEFSSNGIRVNAIAPGIVAVERTIDALSDPKNREPWEERIPLGRIGQ